MIQRTLFKELTDHLTQKEMSLIVGPRQAGKTTLMRLLEDQLQTKGARTLFLNLDIERDKEYFASQEALLKKIRLEFGKEQGYVFLDEIQRKDNAGLFLKGLYDMNLPYKFIVSGSGSVELKEKIHESLAGRKRIFELTTLTFEEFVHFKTDYTYAERLAEFFEVERTRSRDFLEEYLAYGGYPRVVLEESLQEKQRHIDEIYQSYLEKDISFLLGVRKTADFTRLVKLMASQIGNLVNVSELASTLGISLKTVQQYLWYLEQTFILERVTPFFTNVRKEITKSPVFYFSDLGLCNYAAGEFGATRETRKGFLFENFIYHCLREQVRLTPGRVHFWRTKDGAEVDFVVAKGEAVIPLEVKYRTLQSLEMTRSFKNFLLKYNPAYAYIINLTLKQDEQIGPTHIQGWPFYELLLSSLRSE